MSYIERFRPLIHKLLKYGVTPADAALLSEKFYCRTYQAKEHLFTEGDQYPFMVYVLSGYLQLYTTEADGTTNVRILAGPGDFAGCVEATLYDQPAFYTAECITKCQFVIIDGHFQRMVREKSEWFRLLQAFILRRIVALSREKEDMLPLRATDRYLYFKRRYPLFVDNIPAGIIADYIGVRPQSLSRIKHSLR
ncbi:hypothetical protein LEM8419_02376 [Neolewinella maritima]|uniref:Cyclic nucleotide-binding domain-containing protein n=1 Tax=Neolewinella maritima TaxID=1383882 RepID=A0ABM9B2A4_9BACT|nr:Crp/Fnr family transcriptional regulator [Neolewinella maritima]CAH1001473.1 hypothetical protein LEM8419_02376 [Neolewinella maritima]